MIRSVDAETGEITEVRDPDTGVFRIMQDGGLVQAKKPKAEKNVRCGGGKRGVVRGCSVASRLRQLRLFRSLDSSVLPLFVTFTYPSEYPLAYTEWKRHLDVFAKRFARRFSDGAIIWRLEPQRRGAPHYHMFLYGVEYTKDNLNWLSSVWYQIVDSGDEKHLRRGTHVEKIKNYNGAMYYASKYIAKVQDTSGIEDESIDWEHVGRWWGIKCRKNLPWSQVFESDQLSYKDSVSLLRNMRRYLKSQGRRVSGCLPGLTIFVSSPKQWANNIDGLCGGLHRTSHTYQSVSSKWQC